MKCTTKVSSIEFSQNELDGGSRDRLQWLFCPIREHATGQIFTFTQLCDSKEWIQYVVNMCTEQHAYPPVQN